MRPAAPLAAAALAAALAAAVALAPAAVASAEPSLVEPARVAAALAPATPSLVEPARAAAAAVAPAKPSPVEPARAAAAVAPATPSPLAASAASPAATAPSDAAPAVASAPALPVDPAPALGSASVAYLEPGIAVGGTRDGLYGAVHLDGGHRLGGALWLHARLAQGEVTIINLAASSAPMLSSFTEARLGFELRGCRTTSHLCLFGGVDAGYALQTFQRPGDMSTAAAGPSVATATARLGLEVGRQALRFRTSIEAARGQDDWGTGGLTLGIARTW